MPSVSRRALVAIALASSLSLLASCAVPAVPTATPTKPAAGAPGATSAPAAATKPAAAATTPPTAKIKRGGTLVRADFRDAPTMDPAFSANSSELAESPALETLLRYVLVEEKTGKHEFQPWLAESHQLVDPKTLVVKLRKGVKYHDGSDFTAETAKWHLDRSRTDAKSLSKAYQAAVDNIVAEDANTLRFNLKGPSATLLLNLSNAAGGTGSTGVLFVSKAAFDREGADGLARKAVGTGPFAMEDWKRDDKTLYKKFDQYWKQGEDGQKLPYLDRIEVRVLRDKAVGLLEAKAGTVHVVMKIDNKDIDATKANSDLRFVLMPWGSVRGYANYNPKKSPWGTNLKLRQASAYAIDRQTMAKALGFGYSIPNPYLYWIEGFPGYDEKNPRYDYNAEKATQLIKEAGFPDGVDLELPFENPGSDQRVAEMLHSMWTKVGIRAKVLSVESTAFKQMSQAGNFEVALGGTFGSPDPDLFSRTMVCGGSANWAGYCNPELDKCLEEGRTTVDFAKRDEIYKRCQKVLYDDAVYIGLINTPVNIVYRKEVKNLKVNWHLVDLREAWLE